MRFANGVAQNVNDVRNTRITSKTYSSIALLAIEFNNNRREIENNHKINAICSELNDKTKKKEYEYILIRS